MFSLHFSDKEDIGYAECRMKMHHFHKLYVSEYVHTVTENMLLTNRFPFCNACWVVLPSTGDSHCLHFIMKSSRQTYILKHTNAIKMWICIDSVYDWLKKGKNLFSKSSMKTGIIVLSIMHLNRIFSYYS